MKYLLYILVYGFWWLLAKLPFWLLYRLSDGLYLVITYVVKYRKRVIWQNLSSSFPEKSEKELRKLMRNNYRWFCDYIVESLKLMTMSREEMMKRMTFTNVEAVNEILERGQSVALYLGHIGNWEWVSSMPYWTPKAFSCQLYHPLENQYFDRLFKFVRERHGAHCIPMQESLRKILQYQRKGKPLAVGYIADQTPFWWNIHHWLNFLHHDTPVLTGAERIVKHTNQAFVYGQITRKKRGHYNCELIVMNTDTPKMGRFEITDQYFKALEENIRLQPEIYLWTHNRWKRTRQRFDEHFEYVDGKVRLREGKPMIW